MSTTEILADGFSTRLRSTIADDVFECDDCSEQISLKTAIERFATEAIHGTCQTGRYRCGYTIWGSGPPLVFVHGLADQPHSFVLPMALLSRQFRCIAYSLPDGRNDAADLRRYTHANLVADLFVLLDHLNIRRTSIFGSSFGSTITLAAMHAHPARITRAVLQGGFARRPLLWTERLLALCARHWPGQMRSFPLRRTLMLHRQNAPFAARPADDREYLLECTGQASICAVMRRALIMDALDLRPLLPGIRRPVLIVCGDSDHLIGKDREAELLDGLPEVRRVEITGCAHFPYLTHPEILADVVRHFLTPPQRETRTHTDARRNVAACTMG